MQACCFARLDIAGFAPMLKGLSLWFEGHDFDFYTPQTPKGARRARATAGL